MNEEYEDKKIIWFKQVCSEYMLKRNKHMKVWRNLYSFIRRAFGCADEYTNLLFKDLEFDHSMQKWFSQHVAHNKISASELNDFLIYIRNHRERLSDRVIFIVLFATMLAFFFGLKDYKFFRLVELAPLIIFTIICVVEQSEIEKRKSAYAELANMIDTEIRYLESNKA